MTGRRPRGTPNPTALLHALEVHQAELEAQNAELAAANAALQASNAALVIARDRFQALYEWAPIPYLTIDARHTIVDLNHAATQILGLSRAELQGRTSAGLVVDADRPHFETFLAAVAAGGQARANDIAMVRADGDPVVIQIDGVTVRDAAGAHCVLALVDLTERRLAESIRRTAQEEVLEVVSHDLRGPINAIGLACEALSSQLGPEELHAYVSAIERSAARCERLIRDLLGHAQLEHGVLELHPAAVDLRELVQAVCADYAPAVAAAGSSLTLGAPPTPQVVMADRDRLHQVLSNLISNSLVHARGAAIAVTVSGAPGFAELTVADDGPGIPAEELPHVFDRFRRGLRRRRGGTGLGLAIVKGLVLAHHGTVTVDNQPGHGARTVVRLPLAPDQPALAPPREVGRRRPPSAGARGARRPRAGEPVTRRRRAPRGGRERGRTASVVGTPLASRAGMIPHYRIALPRISIEGRRVSGQSGTGVSAMIALAYIRAWSPDAAVAIYPSALRAALDRATVVASDAVLDVVCGTATRVMRVAAGAGSHGSVIYGHVDALWSLARRAQPSLMARLDDLVGMLPTGREDDALARLHREVRPLDLDLDLLGGVPELAVVPLVDLFAWASRHPARRDPSTAGRGARRGDAGDLIDVSAGPGERGTARCAPQPRPRALARS